MLGGLLAGLLVEAGRADDKLLGELLGAVLGGLLAELLVEAGRADDVHWPTSERLSGPRKDGVVVEPTAQGADRTKHHRGCVLWCVVQAAAKVSCLTQEAQRETKGTIR